MSMIIYLVDIPADNLSDINVSDRETDETGESHHMTEDSYRKIIDDIRGRNEHYGIKPRKSCDFSSKNSFKDYFRQLVSDNTKTPESSLKSDTFEPIFDKVKNIINLKDSQYSSDPIKVLSVTELLYQIRIKAVRADLATTLDKFEDEMLDIITYALLTLNKVYEEADRGEKE